MKKILGIIWNWLKKQNETLGLLLLIYFAWYLMPPLLRLYDPKAVEFGIEILYVPIVAIIFCLIGLIFAWVVLAMMFPKGKKILDNIFEDKDSKECQKRQFILRLFGYLLALFAVSMIAVTSISVII